MEPLNNDDRLEYAIRHPKLFSADAREGRSRRFVRTILVLIGALFVMAFGIWFASNRETAAEAPAQIPDVRSRIEAPTAVSTVFMAARRTAPSRATFAADDRQAHIYKCVGKSGSSTFQQNPCPSGSTTDKVIPYTPKYEPERAQGFPSGTGANQVQQYASSAGPAIEASPNSTCRAAEIWADGRRRVLGIHATFTDLRMLQDYVYERCK